MTSVRTERDGHVAHLILAAPARRNVRAGHLKPPTIAAIQGAAVGAGVNLAAATDLRVVAEQGEVG